MYKTICFLTFSVALIRVLGETSKGRPKITDIQLL